MPDGLLQLPERYPGRTLACIGLLFAIAYGASAILLPKHDRRIVVGDAEGYYVQLRSAVFDRDLQFRNDYARLEGLVDGTEIEAGIAAARATPTGYQRNYMPVGPAFVWAPLFLVVAALVWIVDRLGAAYPLDGYAPLFQLSAGLSGIAAATIGSWLAYLAAAELFERRVAIWSTLTLWLSSSAIYYSLVSPAYSHAASMLAVGAFWLFWLRTLRRQTPARYAIAGLLVGVAALMRWQDAILLLVPALDAFWADRVRRPDAIAIRFGACAACAAIAFIPQMVVWQSLYGQWFTVPQGPGFMQWDRPALWSVLVSDNHGLFAWTPVVAVAVAGFVPLTRRHRVVGAAAAVFLIVSWYVNAAVADWWAGEAFGARRFLSCYPLFVLGFAAVAQECRMKRGALVAVGAGFTGYTFLLLLQYQAFMHGLRDIVPYPGGFVNLWLWRFRAPVDLLVWWFGR